MTQAITIERWNQAQAAERKLHKMGFNEGIGHYYWSYRNYFKYLNIRLDQQGKYIMEVGPADFPALMFCENYRGYLVEPMPSHYLEQISKWHRLPIYTMPIEQLELQSVDEIWLLNIMQHVIDPELFIDKCKQAASCIRFFEPINQPICEHHPHTFGIEDFERWYGTETINYYDEKLPGFFDDKCVYGVWVKNKQ